MTKFTVLVALVLTAFNVWAGEEKNRAMFDMMISMVKNAPTGELDASAKCLGVSKAKLAGILEQGMEACYQQHKSESFEQFMASIESCTESSIQKHSGFSQAQVDRCKSAHDDGYDDSAPEAFDMAAHEARLAETMQSVSKASEKTLHLITLPIYQNSQVMMHAIDGVNFAGVDGSLPAATFASVDSAEQILAFYKKQLPAYKYKRLEDGAHILMETMPADFDLLTHSNMYMTTPHVLIRSMQDPVAAGAPEGTQSSFELAYKER